MPRPHSIESRITSLLREARKRTILSPLRAISDGLMPGCITIRHLLICVLSLGINLSATSIPVTRALHPQRHIPSSSAPAALILQNSPWQLDRSGVLGFSALILIEGICIVLLLRNISRRKRAHEGLGRKEREIAEALRLAKVGSWQWDARKESFIWSTELYRIHGLDPTLPPPSYGDFLRLFTPESRDRLRTAIETASQTGSFPKIELEVRGADGCPRWVVAGGEALRDAGGNVTHLRGTVQDITERKQAEQSRSRLASIVDSSDDAIISKTLEGIITSWNHGAEKIFGFSEAEAVGQSINILIPSDLLGEEETIARRARAGEKVEHYETIRLTKERKRINVSLTLSELIDDAGRAIGLSNISRDITDRKHSEQKLKESEEQYRRVVDHLHDAIMIDDVEGRVVFANDRFQQLFGFDGEELHNVKLEDYVAPNWRASLRERHERRFRGESVDEHFEYEGVRRNGEEVWLEVNVVPIRDSAGKVTQTQSLIRDITERRRAEEAIVESEERFRLLANTAPVLIWMSGPDKLCHYFNQPWLEFTGRRMEEEIGDGWVIGVHSDDRQMCLDTYASNFDRREKFKMEYRLRRYDGKYRWVLDVGTPRFNSDASFAGYVGCCIDISDQKQAQGALIEISGRLIHAQEEERTRIARELHDDINQRLALLANRVQECEQTASATSDSVQENALREIWRLTNEIATDIQQMSHHLHPSKLNYLGLAPSLRDLCREFSRQHKIEIECVARDLPQDMDENTSLSLYRTVQEALRNAVKHSHAQHVKVQLTSESNMVRLWVSDDGVGFNPKQERNQHGLGLVSMRERLRSAGGEFSIDSAPSRGTRVEGWVPATRKLARLADKLS